MMKKEKLPIENKSSWVLVVLCIIILLVAVMSLQNLNHIFWKSNHSIVEEEVKEPEIPSSYQCSYGPMYDEFYGYTKYESVLFKFDESGNVSSTNSEIRYQVYSSDEYNHMLQILTLPLENVIYDEENYVVTAKDTSTTRFPSNYADLRKYLSSNRYTCVSES